MLVAGGDAGSGYSAELYDPATGIWTLTGSLNTGRYSHTPTLLSDGRVLAAGGIGDVFLLSAELYDPGIVTATHVDGRGAFDNQGNEVTFRFRITQADDGSRLGHFAFCDTAAGVCTIKGITRSLSITGNTADFSGEARLDDGSVVTFNVNATDNGEPGTLDTMSISLSNGYSPAAHSRGARSESTKATYGRDWSASLVR